MFPGPYMIDKGYEYVPGGQMALLTHFVSTSKSYCINFPDVFLVIGYQSLSNKRQNPMLASQV